MIVWYYDSVVPVVNISVSPTVQAVDDQADLVQSLRSQPTHGHLQAGKHSPRGDNRDFSSHFRQLFC